MMKQKLLVTGASGFLGHTLCPMLATNYEVVGTYFRNLPKQKAVEWVRINLLETNQVISFVQQQKPTAILHLAAVSNTTFCEEHPVLSHHINVYTTITLAEAAARLQIPLIYTSTDLVFNGHTAPYSEDDFAYPISKYGQQKHSAEETLLADFERTLVVRLPLLFGNAPTYTTNFYQQSINQLKEGKKIVAFTDEFRSMLSTKAASQGIVQALAYALDNSRKWKEKERLLHLGGSERYSRYEFMKTVAQQMGLDAGLIIPSSQSEAPYAHIRPMDVCLDNTLAEKKIGFKPPSLATQLQEMIAV